MAGPESKASHDGGIRETAATLREVGAEDLAVGRESHRLAQPQNYADDNQGGKSVQDSRDCRCRGP